MKTLDEIFNNFPNRIYRQGQHTMRLQKGNDFFWGVWNGYTNFAEVFHINGDRHETLTLDDIDGWVNESIFMDNGYTLLNVSDI